MHRLSQDAMTCSTTRIGNESKPAGVTGQSPSLNKRTQITTPSLHALRQQKVLAQVVSLPICIASSWPCVIRARNPQRLRCSFRHNSLDHLWPILSTGTVAARPRRVQLRFRNVLFRAVRRYPCRRVSVSSESFKLCHSRGRGFESRSSPG